MSRDVSERIDALAQSARRAHGHDRLWLMFEAWDDLLLASWRVPEAALRSMVPSPLEIDTFQGSAWVSLVPFRATDMRIHGLPPIAGEIVFGELNFRTYVRCQGVRGVYFISLDCEGKLASFIGERRFGLPFREAAITIDRRGQAIHAESRRITNNGAGADFVASYTPRGVATTPTEGSLEQFLTERLTLFVVGRDGEVHRGDIFHDPWRLQPVDVDIEANTIPAAEGITLSGPPAHTAFAPHTDSFVYFPTRLTQGSEGKSMAHFKFVTFWRVRAPLEAVWAMVYDYERWPDWWRGVKQVKVIKRGGPDAIGTEMDQIWRSALPYDLHFRTRLSRVEPLRMFEVTSQGMLNGVGLIEFSRDEDVTVVRFDWEVDTTEPWMNFLAPAARPVFGWNHAQIMDWGGECLSQKLGAELVSTEHR